MEIVLLAATVLLLGLEGLYLIYLLQRTFGGEEKKPVSPALPLNPFAAHKVRKEEKDLQRERDRLDTIMRNIENYDGTGANQEDVPGR